MLSRRLIDVYLSRDFARIRNWFVEQVQPIR
jgi:hypothetical protein